MILVDKGNPQSITFNVRMEATSANEQPGSEIFGAVLDTTTLNFVPLSAIVATKVGCAVKYCQSTPVHDGEAVFTLPRSFQLAPLSIVFCHLK